MPAGLTVLGLDYGPRRIGVAVGQSLTGTARPLATLHAVRNQPDWRRLAQLVADWRPQALVVGLPLNMDGSRQVMTQRAQRFMRQLRHRYRLPVYAEDERLSSYAARRLRRRRGEALHPLAAGLIVESWLRARAAAGDAAPRA